MTLFKGGLFNPASLGMNHDELIATTNEPSIDILAINEIWLPTNEEAKAP